ncbi:microfibril-associated glycoprotein 4 [Nematostella vectensis]|uniref:microfibril-associated glycoprotein 4 n=1 Tax=Nematostella vectensis TaxID=45351 RepID=UPI002076DD91|nr:microfibril-associated glycoprotein 4 [Nematostella vectensis]
MKTFLVRFQILGLLVFMLITTGKCQTCKADNGPKLSIPIQGRRLVNNVFKTLQESKPMLCYAECQKDKRCQSINFLYDSLTCELNNRTKEAKPDDFAEYEYGHHMELDTRVPLGSVYELPGLSCEEIFASDPCSKNGNYYLSPDNQTPFLVRCKFDQAPVIWTVILQRSSGAVNFARTFDEYGVGIGTPGDDNFLLGLDSIHRLTNSPGAKRLLVRLEDWDGNVRFAEYDNFAVGSKAQKYTLALQYRYQSGDAGDSLTISNGMPFTAYDQDNDQNLSYNCAAYYGGGGWWHNECFEANFNNPYYNSAICPYAEGITWMTWHGHRYSLKKVAMLVRNV